MIIYFPLFSQENIKELIPPPIITIQDWSMELRAIYESKTFIDNKYVVSSQQSISCRFSIAYNHGQNYWETRRVYYFDYGLFKNGVQIAQHTVEVYGLYQDDNTPYINNYIAYYEFPNNIIIGPNDIIEGGLIISYQDINIGGGLAPRQPILPETSFYYYQYTPNSIQFIFNTPNTTVSSLLSSQCPDIMPTTYWDVVQATNSITLNPGFNVNSTDKNFLGEIANPATSNALFVTNSQENPPTEFINLVQSNNKGAEFITVYPNPTARRFTIKNIYTKDIVINIFNKNGERILAHNLFAGETFKVNLPQTNSKIVVVIASISNQIVAKKIVILK